MAAWCQLWLYSCAFISLWLFSLSAKAVRNSNANSIINVTAPSGVCVCVHFVLCVLEQGQKGHMCY